MYHEIAKAKQRKRDRRIRIIVFFLAALAILGGFACRQYMLAKEYKMRLDQNYQRSITDLGGHINKISTTLNKGRLSGSAAQSARLAADLWRETSAAKIDLSLLPFDSVNLSSTTKFLSQCGDYAMAMSRKLSNNETLTEEELKNLDTLYQYSVKLKDQVEKLADLLEKGGIPIQEAAKLISDENVKGGEKINSISGGFKDLEDSFGEFPTLIYDGPFSDEFIEKEPVMTKDAKEIGKEEARKKAAEFFGTDNSSIRESNSEEGRMPSYSFETGTKHLCITKNGGFLSYMIDSREIGEPAIAARDAFAKAREYLNKLGLEDMAESYYEIRGNIMTINYAYYKDEIIYYTDLIKIEAAMDNGEIVGYNARGYLTNHIERELPVPAISREEAAAKVNQNLSVENVQLAVIPSGGGRDVFTYEFNCTSADGQTFLVYINAETGAEEQILVLLNTADGVLTM
ncbi:MAG: germination protein YpeB [Oscillospiraceae bacterium]|jgi:germination protein YpeB|nr:germination protein YpeB [Oscillospiraceae bacterium]